MPGLCFTFLRISTRGIPLDFVSLFVSMVMVNVMMTRLVKTQSIHVHLDGIAIIILGTIANAGFQFGRLLLPIQDGDTVIASQCTFLTVEHTLAQAAVILDRGRTQRVCGTNPLGHRAADHGVRLVGTHHLWSANLDALFGDIAEFLTLTIAPH